MRRKLVSTEQDLKQSKRGTGEAQMMREVWKSIDGYDYPYEISSQGRVLGVRGLMKPYDNGYGYLVVELRKDGKRKHLRVHRLVA